MDTYSYPTLKPILLDRKVTFDEFPEVMKLGFRAFLRERALENDTLVIWRNGAVVKMPAQTLLDELLAADAAATTGAQDTTPR